MAFHGLVRDSILITLAYRVGRSVASSGDRATRRQAGEGRWEHSPRHFEVPEEMTTRHALRTALDWPVRLYRSRVARGETVGRAVLVTSLAVVAAVGFLAYPFVGLLLASRDHWRASGPFIEEYHRREDAE